jgi:hypothetical protein
VEKLLKESQENFNFKVGPEETTSKGFKYKKLYIFGNTFELNKHLKGVGSGIGKEFKARYDRDVKAWYFPIYPDKTTGEYDIQGVKDRKVRPYVDKVNEFYKYTLDIDKLIDELEDYTPSETSQNPNAPQVATKEEANEIRRRLEGFKEMLLNMSSSEELQSTMKLMMDVKAGKSKYQFSANNKIAIKTQRPDATIVCNRNNWAKWYNRTVKPDAKPIFVNSASSGGYNKNITQDFLGKVGASRYGNLSGKQKEELHNLQAKSKYGQARTFAWVAFYDVKDTVQIEGTHDEIGADMERAKGAADKLGDKTLGDIDGGVQTTSDENVIKPVYDGLLAYADAQNIGVNQKGGIMVSKDVNASSTKLLSSALLSQILGGKLKGIASRASVEAKTPSARRQQAEVASWQFMDAFGVEYNLADVDMDVIFGAPEAGKDYEKQKEAQKKQIHNVLGDIADAVNHLIDFVNIHIKDTANLSEVEGNIPQGKHVTASDIAKDLGIPSDMLNEVGVEELYERLRRRFNLV